MWHFIGSLRNSSLIEDTTECCCNKLLKRKNSNQDQHVCIRGRDIGEEHKIKPEAKTM